MNIARTKGIIYFIALLLICFQEPVNASILCNLSQRVRSLTLITVPIRSYCSHKINGSLISSNGTKILNNDLDLNDPLDFLDGIIFDQLVANKDALDREKNLAERQQQKRLIDKALRESEQLELTIDAAVNETYQALEKEDHLAVVAIDPGFKAWLSAVDLDLESDFASDPKISATAAKKKKTPALTKAVLPPTLHTDDNRLMRAELEGISFYTLAEFYRLYAKYIAVDLEATGENDNQRITDVACVLVDNWKMTDQYFQRYVNPECKTTWMSRRITGYTDSFLSQFQTFDKIAPELFAYIGHNPLVFHGGQLDLMLLNKQGKITPNIEDRQPVIDTEKFSRELFPNQKSNLNAACERLGIKTIDRTYHGALIDAKYTAELFCRMFKKNGSQFPTSVLNWKYFPKFNIYERFPESRGTLGEIYFQNKGIKDVLPPSIRFSPELYHPTLQEHYPAILVSFENNMNELQGVFVRYLNITKSPIAKENQEHEKHFYGWAEDAFANIAKGASQKIVFYANLMNALMIKDLLKSEHKPTFLSFFKIDMHDEQHINIKAVLDDTLLIKVDRYQPSEKTIFVIDKITSGRRQTLLEQYRKWFQDPPTVSIFTALERFTDLKNFRVVYKNSLGKIVSDLLEPLKRTLVVESDKGTKDTIVIEMKDSAGSINSFLDNTPPDMLVYLPIVTNFYICELIITTNGSGYHRPFKIEKYDIDRDVSIDDKDHENIHFTECHFYPPPVN